jgi:hypothetical protein
MHRVGCPEWCRAAVDDDVAVILDSHIGVRSSDGVAAWASTAPNGARRLAISPEAQGPLDGVIWAWQCAPEAAGV